MQSTDFIFFFLALNSSKRANKAKTHRLGARARFASRALLMPRERYLIAALGRYYPPISRSASEADTAGKRDREGVARHCMPACAAAWLQRRLRTEGGHSGRLVTCGGASVANVRAVSETRERESHKQKTLTKRIWNSDLTTAIKRVLRRYPAGMCLPLHNDKYWRHSRMRVKIATDALPSARARCFSSAFEWACSRTAKYYRTH